MDRNNHEKEIQLMNINPKEQEEGAIINKNSDRNLTFRCSSCGNTIQHQYKIRTETIIHALPGLPAGVKFDPTDLEILEHLEAKVISDPQKIHPLIDEFIPTLEGENGICYTHPEKLPGVKKDGQIRHFFHRPSKAYTTGTRKRRKVDTDDQGNETRWHKTGKTRPIFYNNNGSVKGFKKILVLYTNYGRQRKPEKTNWVMHQYHSGNNEEEKEGELIVSKVFFQTQPRHCGSDKDHQVTSKKAQTGFDFSYADNISFVSYDQGEGHRDRDNSTTTIQDLDVEVGVSTFIRLASGTN